MLFRGGDKMTDISVNEKIASFFSGNENKAYKWLGAHKEQDGFVFRVWAPEADGVYVVGSFNNWQESCPMTDLGGVWEARIPTDTISEGDSYKYLIKNGESDYYRSDPYSFKLNPEPYFDSVITDIDGYNWHDGGWMEQRREVAAAGIFSQPLNIYELHPGSWMRKSDGSFLSYSEIADELAPYVKQMGYTHVELLPVAEHPYYGSWGYQTGAYYAPTSRYGDAKELMSFVDTMHRAGVGVIFDLTLAHFAKDEFGLYNFDGSHLYEPDDEKQRENRAWGTAAFDFGKGEVASFLISNVVYWIEKYHIDSIRIDAVSSMIYLDYDRGEGNWTPNKYGDNRNLDAIAFLKKMNSTVKELYPSVMTIAEESSAWQGVTSFEGDGLGFDFKWNMGWMNDTLGYASTPFKERKYQHGRLTFPLVYAFSEKFILPISHDEVVHGKRSFLDKMFGGYSDKFAGARAFEAFRMTSPGKKLTFMGNEIGQFREWDHNRETEWFLLDYETHYRHQHYLADLNNFYLAHPELWQKDDGWDGFRWIEPDDSERSIISYRRIAENSHELIVVINFTPAAYKDFVLAVPTEGVYEEIFNSDEERYGGGGFTNNGVLLGSRPNPNLVIGKPAEEICPYVVRMKLPPLGAVIIRLKRRRFSDVDEL